MIQFDAVHKRFPNGTTAVNDLSLEMPEGGVTVPVGSSGRGKTTTQKYGPASPADLARQNGRLVIGAAPGVKKRRVGAIGLRDVYGVQFKEFTSPDPDRPPVKAP